MKKNDHPQIPRRSFLGTATAFTIVPRNVLGGTGYVAPSDKLNIAGIGVGGMGGSNLAKCAAQENITALCDVDWNYAEKVFQTHAKAKRYRDFREMLDKEDKNVDAVIVATPDHSHAVIGMEVLRRKKHVYIQKPMAHSVYEVRRLTEEARKQKVMTQMGNQGRSGDGVRLLCEWIWAGAIGKVTDVHAWTNRPVWPQGVEVGRPAETPPVPEGFDWDRWIGPAPFRPYHPTYHPGQWRGWWDFGTGSLGDLGCHIMDPIFWPLKLKYPISVEGCISTYWEKMWTYTEPKNEMYPRSTIVRFRFPAREDMPEVNLTWWDGGLLPPRPEELELGRRMGDSDGGVLFIGEKGTIMCGCYGRSPRLIPETKMQSFQRPKPYLERIPEGESGHEKDWIRSCKDGKPASSHFENSGPLSETVLMGNLAVRFPQRKLVWDGLKMEVTNDKDANAYVRRQYRPGWSL